MALNRPWIEGLRPVPGSLRLIGLRWMLWMLAALPGLFAAYGALTDGPARRPFFVDAPRPLPLVHLSAWTMELPGAALGPLAAASVVAWLAGLLLTAAAVELLAHAGPGRVRVWRTIFDRAPSFVWPYLRIAVLAVLWAALGLRLLGLVFERLGDHAALAGWTGESALMNLPFARALLSLLWISIVGVSAFWARVIVVDDRRHFVRRMHGVLPRLLARRPLGGLLLHVTASLATLGLGAVVLAAWRQSGGAMLALWIPLWMAVLLANSYVWHWRLRACLLTWHDPRLGRLREAPDEPWRVLRRSYRWVRGRFGSRRPARRSPQGEAGPAPAAPGGSGGLAGP